MITIGLGIMAAGALVVALFAYLVLRQPPGQPAATVNAATGVVRERSVAFGLATAVLFFAGTALFSAGSAIVATTLGYGRF